MITELLTLAASLASFAGGQTSVETYLAEQGINTRGLYYPPETTGFADAYSIAPSNLYISSLSGSTDVDYYCFAPSTAGFYTLSVAADDFNVSVYGQHSGSFSFLGSYVVSSTESNYGRNHVRYLDPSVYSSFYYAISKPSVSGWTFYSFTFSEVTKLGDGSFEVVKYDVATGFYSFLTYYSPGYGAPTTTGYDPSGYPYGSYPSNYACGTHIALTTANGYDTTTTYPYAAVGRIAVPLSPSAADVSSGFLIGPNVFATAAHCLSSDDCMAENLSSTTVSFGSNGENSYAARGHIETVYLSPDFWHSVDGDHHDWALCVMDDDYGNDVGYLPIIKDTSASLDSSHKFVIDGYQNACVYQTLSYADFVNVSYGEFQYTAVTAGGDSGAPVFDLKIGKVVGIHNGAGTYAYGEYFGDSLFYLAKDLIAGGTI